MKKIILILALCATFVTSAFAQVGEGEIPPDMPTASAPVQQPQQAPPETEAPKQEEPTPQEDCPPVQVQTPVTAPDCPKEQPQVVHRTSTRTIVRYRTVNNRTIVREVDNRELEKLQDDFAAYKREINERFQLTKRYADAKADQAYEKAVGTSNRYTDQKVQELERKLEPRLVAVEEQGNSLALILGVLGILGLAGLFMLLIGRR